MSELCTKGVVQYQNQYVGKGRKGHGLSNGHVVKTASEAGASIILDSDAHEPEDLMTKEYAEKVALGSGLNLDRTRELLEESPIALLHRLKLR